MATIKKYLSEEFIYYTFEDGVEDPVVKFMASLPRTPTGSHPPSQVNRALANAFRIWLDNNFPDELQEEDTHVSD